MSERRTGGRFRPGDWVEVRSLAEILSTLGAQGATEGLPFMPEMVAYCGRRFPVYRRVEKVVLEGHNTVMRLKNTVFLEQVRCDGQSHNGCQRGCRMLWKEAWLKPAGPGETFGHSEAPCGDATVDLPTRNGDKHRCQATELIHCTSGLPWWDVRQYVRDYFARRMNVGSWVGMLASLTAKRLRWLCGLKPQPAVAGRLDKTSGVRLALQPGEWVQVKSRQEIEATLDIHGKNRGLEFMAEMADFCGRRFRVLSRVDHMILEWTGEMRQISDTVTLDHATCSGMMRRCCPRDCHHLWREVWLKRVEPSLPATDGSHLAVAAAKCLAISSADSARA